MLMRKIYSLSDQGLSMPEQGTEEWLKGREGRITGSKGGDLFFEFKQESDWDVILKKWFGSERQEFDAVARSRMDWGSKHEDTAVGVIVEHIPNVHFFECPQININDVYAVSPDGAMIVLKDGVDADKQLSADDIDWHANVEIKCPAGGVGKSHEEMRDYLIKKWKRPATYYMTQIHQEMAGQGVDNTLFVVWTPLMTRMWRVPFDASYWDLCLEVFENFRKKNVPYDVMKSKVDTLKRRSWGVSNVPIWKDIHHT